MEDAHTKKTTFNYSFSISGQINVIVVIIDYKQNHQLPPAINRKLKENLGRHESGIPIPVQDVQVAICVL